jgi:transcriptional regulator with XRE-family HTH domain
MRELDPGASPLHFFGAEVRRAREAAGMTLADLGALVPCDASTVSRIESGLLSPAERFATVCDKAFPQMGGWFTRFYQDSRKWDGPYPPWFRDWIEIEQRAASLRIWEPLLVPGLLQTPGYAAGVFASWKPASDDEVDAKVRARIERQGILGGGGPPDLRVLLDESVLRRAIGTASVMGEQLGHLVAMAGRPNITIQLVPAEASAYAWASGAVAVATVPGEADSAHLDTAAQGMTIHEPRLVARIAHMLDELRSDALPRARSVELIQEAAAQWIGQEGTAGASPATPAPTAVSALKRRTSA